MSQIHNVGAACAPSNHRGRTALSLVVAAALGCVSLQASAIQTDFGVDYRATGFYVQSDSFAVDPPTTADGQRLDDTRKDSDSDNGFAHYLRVKANFKHEPSGIEVITSTEIAGDRFTGQNRAYTPTNTQAFNTNSTGDNVRVDLAFVQVPFKYGLMRLGRQESNWNNCFLTCDDRRDRILLLSSIAGITPIFALDRVADGGGFDNQANGNELFTGFVAPFADTGWTLGFLYVHFFNNYKGDLVDTDPALIDTNADGIPDAAAPGSTGLRNVNAQSNLNIYSPYLQGKVGPVSITTGFNYFDDNNVTNNLSPAEDDIFTESAWAEYVRIGAELGMFELNAQYVGTQDGGFVDPGFDSYSSLINNNPDATNSATSVYSMGANQGRKGFDENLYIGRIKANVTEKFYLAGALGFLEVKVPTNLAGIEGGSDTSTVYDFEAGYQFNEALRTWTTFGMIKENSVGTLRGNSLLGTIPNGGRFADERVMAGSVNLGVEF